MSNFERDFSFIDRLIVEIDKGLRTVFSEPPSERRTLPPSPSNLSLTEHERQHAIRLMRVNHSGEIAAQALYQGQAFIARNTEIQEQLIHAAEEEYDHLYWCSLRLKELNGHKSYLNFFWYIGSFSVGTIAGFFGDNISLGFLEETEHQVVQHLESHLRRLPQNDSASRAILEQMQIDESNHATTANKLGAAVLPVPVKWLMRGMSKVMTTTAYFV